MPNDPRFTEQWALRNLGESGGHYGADIGATNAWTKTTGSQSTVVAVIDSGIDFTHPDLRDNQWTNEAPGTDGDLHGWDYVRSSVLGGHVIADLNNNGEWLHGYVYLGTALLAYQEDGRVLWVHSEPVTKAKRTTDTTGTVVNAVEVDPFGGEARGSVNSWLQPHRFTTYERDQNNSDEAQHRRYNRWWSRFDQADPSDGSYDLSDPQSFNRYSYVQNDPVNFVDPSGLEMCTDNWCGGAGFNAGIGYSGFGGWGGGKEPQPQQDPQVSQPCADALKAVNKRQAM